MSRLFAALYLDEDVSVLLAALLRSRGFEAVTTLEAGNIAAPMSDNSKTRRHVIWCCLHTIAPISSGLQRNTSVGGNIMQASVPLTIRADGSAAETG